MMDSNTRLTKAMIDAMTLAEFEQLSPDEKVLVDIAQYAETEEYSKLWTAHIDGKREGIAEGIEQGLEQGLQQGLAEGLAEGEHRKAIETARNFLQLGLSIEQVASGTGLSIEQVTALKADLDGDSN